LQAAGIVFVPDLNKRILYRIRADGHKEEAPLLPGEDGFALAYFPDGRVATEWANLLVQDRELKRPAAASAIRATATISPEQPEQHNVEPAREPERPASTPRQWLPPGWRAVQHTRQTGRAADQTYMEYFDAEGNRYRSRKQIEAHLKTIE
jgi:hypothetical protein